MIGLKIYEFIKELFDIPRSITGEGVRKTLKKIKVKHLKELKIYEVPSGTKVGDWVIPKEWNIYDAFIKNEAGERIVDFKKNNLHVLNYCKPVDKKIDFEELNSHLYSIPEQPNSIPYVTSYYEEKWGFCMTHKQRSKLKNEKYSVYVDSELKEGSLTYADLVIEGKKKDEIFFSTYICHPSMANNELSGPGVSTYLAKFLSKRSNLFTYRFCFIPETIGAITYISRNYDNLKNVYAAFNLTCIGDNRAFSFMPSRSGNTIADKVARHIIKHHDKNFTEFSYMKDRGSDERQFCSPGINLPMVSIMKSKYGEYPEYHTSLDDMDFISPEGLMDSYNIHIDCIKLLENNFRYQSTIYGEPFLSKRGNNYLIVGGKDNEQSRSAKVILDIMTCCDGNSDIIDIAEKLDIYALELIPIFEKLKKEKLIKAVD
tara:strand:+ start:1661 stop:2947 length:1287 start_codon:yes stop_codon:yes gene_type:complete